MKISITVFLIFILTVSFSCKQKHERIYDRLEGSWELKKLEYFDESGKLVTISNSSAKITFFDTRERKGVLKIDNNSYNLIYNFGYEQCNLGFDDQRVLPIDAIGKVNVYKYRFIDKKTIEFNIDKEYDYTDKQIIYDVKYTFAKL